MWDERFEKLLRSHLPFLEEGEEVAGDLNLREFGLDSLGVVDLLVSLEETYDVHFLGEDLKMDTFAAPSVLWATLFRLINSTT
jgi:acyl carrier protein